MKDLKRRAVCGGRLHVSKTGFSLPSFAFKMKCENIFEITHLDIIVTETIKTTGAFHWTYGETIVVE